jgi:hypothetical protein
MTALTAILRVWNANKDSTLVIQTESEDDILV